MDFNLTPEQAMVRQVIRNFARTEVKPLAAEIDDQERFPRETVAKLARYNMMGIPYPKEFGGAGGDTLSYILAVEELSRVCATTGVIVSAHTSLAGYPLFKYGTPEQKQKYLIPLCKGEKLGAFGLTEPNAGSDAAAQQTRAILEDGWYVINGTKVFITNGSEADIFIIFAMTQKELGTRGISAFILEKGMPGFTVGKHEAKLGIRGSATNELVFNDVRVGPENLLGTPNKGFGIAMGTLDGGRIGVAAQALGIAQGAFDEAVSYAKTRVQFGKPIAKNQGIQWMLADLATRLEAARLLVYRAALLKDSGTAYSVEAAMAKLYASEAAMEITTKAVQIHGGYGYTRHYPVERMMRDAKITEIYEGTSEVQRMVIAANILK